MNKYIKDLVYNILNEGLFDNSDLDYEPDIINQIKRDKVNQAKEILNQKINDIISGKLNKKEAIEFMSKKNNIGI